jgi:hypothetical protein
MRWEFSSDVFTIALSMPSLVRHKTRTHTLVQRFVVVVQDFVVVSGSSNDSEATPNSTEKGAGDGNEDNEGTQDGRKVICKENCEVVSVPCSARRGSRMSRKSFPPCLLFSYFILLASYAFHHSMHNILTPLFSIDRKTIIDGSRAKFPLSCLTSRNIHTRCTETAK